MTQIVSTEPPPHAQTHAPPAPNAINATITTSSFSRIATNRSSSHMPGATAVPAHFGSVRKSWRPMLHWLRAFPSIQNAVLETASYFSSPKDIEFSLPRGFHDKYKFAQLLGEGAFGRVHRVLPVHHTSIEQPLDLAVKIVPKQRIVSLADYHALQQEGRMMVLLGGTLNVAHFFGAYEDDENVYLLMEHCVGGDAFTRLQQLQQQQLQPSMPNEPLVAMYMTDILHVVWQCHVLRILHGDLKLENFLFADDVHEDSPLKLTDFGGAQFLPEGSPPLYEVRGTPLYTAPEVLAQSNGYSFPSDMWSCGVILYRLLAGRFPFESGELLDERILHASIDLESAPWPHVSDLAKDLVRQLLVRDPTVRLTADQARQHPWLSAALAAKSDRSSHSTVHPPALLNGTLVQRLQLYRTLNTFQQAVFMEIARLLPLEQKQEIVVLYTEMLKTRNNTTPSTKATPPMGVCLDTFVSALDKGGYRLTLGEVKSFLCQLDLDGDGVLSMDEFCAAFLDWSVIQRECPIQWKAVATQVFKALDRDQNGLLGIDDLALLTPFRINEVNTRQHSFRSDLTRCFRHADVDQDGWIDRDEFQNMLFIQVRAYEHYAQRLRRQTDVK